MDLREYEAAKFELADILRELAATLPANQDSAPSQFDALFARLAEDRFNLVVFGRFNRGKTSLMNALIGADRLPTGILPLTSVITSVAYGSTEKVQVEFEKGVFGYDIPMEALPDYITEKGNPGNVRCIRKARIALPAEILRRGFHFVDTPGLGSAILQNTRTTEEFFSEADAALCVTGYDAPLTEEEVLALRTFARAKVPTFVVVNKQDILSEAAHDEVLAYVREQLRSIFTHDLPQVFSVSATEGLAARLADDAVAAAASGIPALERELTRFLTQDKGVAFIAGLCEGVVALLDEINSPQRGALRSRLDNLQDRYLPNTRAFLSSLPESPHVPSARVATRMSSCGVCERVGSTLYDFMRGFQHELAVSPEARAALAIEGLCPGHLWLYASMGRDRDICLALTPLMKRVTEILAELQRDSRSPSAFERLLERPFGGGCVVCKRQALHESSALKEIGAQFLNNPSPKSAADLPTVCLPHLRKLARRDSSTECDPDTDRLLGALVQRLAPAAARLTEDMQRYVLKRDAIRHGLASEEESHAGKRALGFLAGSRAFPPQP
jgi:GTP-binding protein EngB required for normal cell division